MITLVSQVLHSRFSPITALTDKQSKNKQNISGYVCDSLDNLSDGEGMKDRKNGPSALLMLLVKR